VSEDHSKSPLEIPAFRRFFLATSLNFIGGMMTPITLAFSVFSIDGTGSDLGIILGCQAGANIVFILIGGVLADTANRKTLVQISNVLAGCIALAICATFYFEKAAIPILAIFAALDGAATAIGEPAIAGIVPQILDSSQFQKAGALRAIVKNSGTLIGPMLGSVLIVGIGPVPAFFIDGLTSLAAAAIMSTVTFRVTLTKKISLRDIQLFYDVKDGWRDFASRRWLWVTVATFGILNAIHAGAWTVVGPVVANTTNGYGAPGWGMTVAAEALGMLLCSALLLQYHPRYLLLVGCLGVSLFGLSLLALGVIPRVLIVAPVALVAGAGMEIFSTTWNVVLLQNVPKETLSRIMSYDMLGSFIAVPLGTFLYGFAIVTISSGILLTVSGVIYLALALCLLMVREIRGMEQGLL
jgi:MFS family permease